MTEKPRILLVEDDQAQRTVLSYMLNNQYDVMLCEGFQTALKAFQEFTPDLILSDVNLTDGSGMDLRRAVTTYDALRACPFIFISATSDQKTKNDAALLGIDDFLEKPIVPEILLGAVERVLTRSRQLRETMAYRLDRQVTEPLHPYLPDRIGPYMLHLDWREMHAGGGDFVFHLGGTDGDYVLIGDVVGHGAPAKFFMHSYVGYLYGAAFALRQHMQPASAADLLEIINNAVSEDAFLKRWLFTCMAVHIPYDQGPITIASAGHPPAWLAQSSGVSSMTLRGPMPGLMTNIPYADATIALHKGDRLLLHTDGVKIDANLMRATKDLAANTAARIILDNPTDTPDDATIVIIERLS
jgi:sigma-B regulation protein RsbU (phosphoserine phosphatase)